MREKGVSGRGGKKKKQGSYFISSSTTTVDDHRNKFKSYEVVVSNQD